MMGFDGGNKWAMAWRDGAGFDDAPARRGDEAAKRPDRRDRRDKRDTCAYRSTRHTAYDVPAELPDLQQQVQPNGGLMMSGQLCAFE